MKLPPKLANVISELRPTDGIVTAEGESCLGGVGSDYLIYTDNRGGPLNLHLPGRLANYRVQWIDAESGKVTSADQATTNQLQSLDAETNILWLTRINAD